MNLDELFYAHKELPTFAGAGWAPEKRRKFFSWIAGDLFRTAWHESGTILLPPSFDLIARAYTELHRWFHTEVHIIHCVQLLLRLHELVNGPRNEVLLAIFFHDLVYDPKRFDNEKRSAEQFEKLAVMAYMERERIDRIMRMIESTMHHTGNAPDEVLLNDIDLSILGAPPSIFAKYEENVRREFAHVSDEQWRSGRRGVLAEFLIRPSVFRLPQFQELFENQARTNILNAINAVDAVDERFQ